jgi:hypothetical protein
MSPGAVDEKGTFTVVGGAVYVGQATQKDRVPSDRWEAALYDYVNITITHNNSTY